METEVWRPVKGYEGYYEVSDQGRVKRVAGGMGARIGKILKPSRCSNDYFFVWLHKNGDIAQYLIHRLVLLAFKRPLQHDQAECRHLNGDKTDNRLVNLAWGSKKENAADKLTHNTLKHSEAHYNTHLTNNDVRNIRAIFAAGGIRQYELAAQFKVSFRTISSIVTRRTWTHVTP